MNYWIFQSKPEKYDLRDPANLVPGKTDTWKASRYRAKMAEGDLVFFWMSGGPEIRGIYGWGYILSAPKPEGGSHGVEVKYDTRLKSHVPVSKVKELKLAEYMMILNIPVGTNFILTKKEAEAISSLMPTTERPL